MPFRGFINDDNYKWWALGITVIGGFMSILDTSIVNVALPKMMAAFAVSYDDAQWILTAYTLTMGCVQPTTGYLCDVYGNKRMYLISLVVFILGSALCGMAWNNETMIFFRVVQALGGGMIIPVTLSLVYQVFPVHERNKAMGIWGISAMVAPAIGPTLSGYLTEYWSWRLIFDINIPVGIIAFLLAWFLLRETVRNPAHRFDLFGFITITGALFCLLLALSKAHQEGWTSAYILTLLYIAVIGFALFIFCELRHPEPLLDLSVFNDWNFSVSTMLTFVSTAILMGVMFLLPLYMENVLGYNTIDAGLTLLPAAVCTGIMMPIAAKLADKVGAKPLAIIGLIILFCGTYPFSYLDFATSRYYIIGISIVRGVGLGLFMMPITVLALNTVPLEKINRASSINNALRQISGSLGVAVFTSILQTRQAVHLSQLASMINDSALATKLAITEFSLNNSGLPFWLARQNFFKTAYNYVTAQAGIFAFDDTFIAISTLAGLGIIIALFLRRQRSNHGGEVIILE